MRTATTITGYRNLITGEVAPAHRVGTDEHGGPVYQSVEGWEPTSPYWTDEDGLWHPGPDEASVATPTLAEEHDRLVHPDGSECPDGCGGY